jgi:hypothetical protein
METIADIIKDIRTRNDGGVPRDGESSHCLAEDMLALANRIESACKKEEREVADILKDLFACCRNMQNKLHSINSQVWAVQNYLVEGKVGMASMCVGNIDKETQYIYKGDEYGVFPPIAETLKKTKEFLEERDLFGDFNDYTGFKHSRKEKK